MMGPKQEAQAALFYEFSLEDHVPHDHLLRSIDRFVDIVLEKSVAWLVGGCFTRFESGGFAMMGPRQEAQGALFYDFSIEEFVPRNIRCAALIASLICRKSVLYWDRPTALTVVL